MNANLRTRTDPLNNNPKGMYSYGYFRLWKGFIIMVRFILVLAIAEKRRVVTRNFDKIGKW